MSQLIDGKKIAKKIKNQLRKKINQLRKNYPNLAVILVENREDSKIYVKMKEKQAKEIGIDTHTYLCPADISEQELINTIKYLNQDQLIDGILVQLPLPNNLNTDKIIQSIDPKKDVDCFHPENKNKEIISPVYGAILEMLKSINFDYQNKKICLIVNSYIFGEKLAKILVKKKSKVEIIFINNQDLKEKTKQADLIITAIGKAKFIKKEIIKKDVVIIDVGICRKDGKIYGDVDSANVKEKASFISPVPGGVGPLTIAMLFQNVLKLKLKTIK